MISEVLRLFLWSLLDFDPMMVLQTNAHCGIQIMRLPQEYWRSVFYLLLIVLWEFLCLWMMKLSTKLSHYAKTLLDLDRTLSLQYQVSVERESIAISGLGLKRIFKK